MAPRHNQIVCKHLNMIFKAETLTPATLAWSFSGLIPTKKTGKLWFCVGYWILNQRTFANRFPLSKDLKNICETFRRCFLHDPGLFLGFWKVGTTNHFKQMTTFVCRYIGFRFRITPFRSLTTLQMFQQMIGCLSAHLSFVKDYLDEVLLFFWTRLKHKGHMRQDFVLIPKHGLKAKIQKHEYKKKKVKHLGSNVEKMKFALISKECR